MTPAAQIVAVYPSAKSQRDLVDGLTPILGAAHLEATTGGLMQIVTALEPHVLGGDQGAFHSAINIANDLGERPPWLADAAWQYTVENFSDHDSDGRRGRHARSSVSADD